MTEESYQKLNEYFNIIFNGLEQENMYLLMNICKFIFISEKYKKFVDTLELKMESEELSLTFQEVYVLGKEIIEKTCPCYLQQYESILENGVLDFSYENAYYDSCFRYYSQKELSEININRRFDYSDVVVLIHEFLHSTNFKIQNPLQHLLTEFISIYFEIKAIFYLMEEKHINPNDICWNKRMICTYHFSTSFNQFSFPFAMYLLYWEVNPKYLKSLFNQIGFCESQESFEKECKILLEKFDEIKKSYQTESNQVNFEDYFVNCISIKDDYRYLLGTLLAFYAVDYCDPVDIIQLNKQIATCQLEFNDYDGIEQELDQLLKSIGIDIHHIATFYDSIESIQHFVEYTATKRR